jgi:protocatechuate 3,4-dioxygenase beta subunit
MLRSLALLSGGFLARGAFAETLTMTPRMTAGPFFPDHLPLDQDNDLLHVTNDLTPAVGEVTNVGGRLLDASGSPLKGALIELWQADKGGNYIHSRGESRPPRDAHFQGYGKFETAADGAWKFRTIKPGLYTGRTRHFHFGVTLPGEKRRWTTQLFFAGEPENVRDGILNSIRDEAQRAAILREFKPAPDTKELFATWDIVLGKTPGDGHDDERPGRPPAGRPPERPSPPKGA